MLPETEDLITEPETKKNNITLYANSKGHDQTETVSPDQISHMQIAKVMIRLKQSVLIRFHICK